MLLSLVMTEPATHRVVIEINAKGVRCKEELKKTTTNKFEQAHNSYFTKTVTPTVRLSRLHTYIYVHMNLCTYIHNYVCAYVCLRVLTFESFLSIMLCQQTEVLYIFVCIYSHKYGNAYRNVQMWCVYFKQIYLFIFTLFKNYFYYIMYNIQENKIEHMKTCSMFPH